MPDIKEIEKPNDVNTITNQLNRFKLDAKGSGDNSNTIERNSNVKEVCNAIKADGNDNDSSNAADPFDNASNVINTDNLEHKEAKTNCDNAMPKLNLIESNSNNFAKPNFNGINALEEMFPFGHEKIKIKNGQISLDSIERNKRLLLRDLKKNLTEDEVIKLNCFSMKDVDIDSPSYVNEKTLNVGFDKKENYTERINNWTDVKECKPYWDGKGQGKEFDFDYQPDLEGHPGPSPSVILQVCII